MGPEPFVPAVAASPEGELPQLDANRLHVYHVALELHCLCSTLVATLNRIVKDQLERASLSVVLNVAEAGGRRSVATRRATTRSPEAAPPRSPRCSTCWSGGGWPLRPRSAAAGIWRSGSSRC